MLEIIFGIFIGVFANFVYDLLKEYFKKRRKIWIYH